MSGGRWRLVAGVLALGAAGVLAVAVIMAGRLAPATSVGADRGGPPRIVAMSPAIGVMLRDLGLADLVVGRHGFDMVLPEKVPACGDENAVDYETLLRVQPTHLLFQSNARGLPDRLRELAERSRWTIVEYPLLELDDVGRCVSDLGDRFGARARTGELLQRWSMAMAPRGEGLVRAGRVLLLGGVSPPSAMGPGSWHYQILQRLGGTPAITEGSAWITLDAEDVRRLAPDAIVLILPRSPDAPPGPPLPQSELVPLLGRVGTLDIPAVRRGRIALIDDPLAHTPSTAMIGFADRLAAILTDWAGDDGDR
jgi:ABC-type Fe3+-hydroxamate transport system substrate-binding protein